MTEREKENLDFRLLRRAQSVWNSRIWVKYVEEDIDSGENALGSVGESKQINSISFPGVEANERGESEAKPVLKRANLIKLPSPQTPSTEKSRTEGNEGKRKIETKCPEL